MTDFEVLEDMIEDWTEYVSELDGRVSAYQDRLDRAKRELAELRRMAGKQKENEDV